MPSEFKGFRALGAVLCPFWCPDTVSERKLFSDTEAAADIQRRAIGVFSC